MTNPEMPFQPTIPGVESVARSVPLVSPTPEASRPPITPEPDKVYQNADDELWRTQEAGVRIGTEDRPVRTPAAIAAQKAADKARLERFGRVRETKYTGGGRTETHDSDPAYNPPAEPRPTGMTVIAAIVAERRKARTEQAKKAIDRVMAAHGAKAIVEATGNDTRTAMAMAVARQDRAKRGKR